MSARTDARLPKSLVGGVLVLALVVLALGGAVIAVKVRPQQLPVNSVDRQIAAWQEAVSANPDNPYAHTGLGLALLDAGRKTEAQQAFEDAIRLDPKSWAAMLQLGLLLKDSDPQRAVDLLTSASKLGPQQERITPLIALGDFQLARDNPKLAATAYRRSLSYNPFTFDGHYGLARALEAEGDLNAALKEYEQAKRFDPNNPDVAAAIARVSG